MLDEMDYSFASNDENIKILETEITKYSMR